MGKITIAIDGYASCGKSTLAKALAKELHYLYADSGAMYRAVTLYFLDHDINIKDRAAIEQALEDIHISFKIEAGKNTTYLNGVNVENKIREMRVSDFVSQVSTVSVIRRAMVKMQQEMGKKKGIVMDGRDIGTVVFPFAELKLFMTASIDIRTHRRLDELKAKQEDDIEYSLVRENLLLRDHIDSTRDDSPLRQAEDAIVIDNSNITQEEQLALGLKYAQDTIKKLNPELV